MCGVTNPDMKAYSKRLFAGRLNLATYFVGIFTFLSFIGLCWLLSLLLLDGYQSTPAAYIFTVIYMFLGLTFFISITVRRLHDRGYSGWNIWLDYELTHDGNTKQNKYGKPPGPKIDLKTLFVL